MGKIVLILLAIILAVTIVTQYKEFFIVLSILGIAAYLVIKHFKKKKASTSTANSGTETISRPSKSDPASIQVTEPSANCRIDGASQLEPNTKPQPEIKPKDPRLERFERELRAIPRENITLSEPAPRHLLKDLPPYTFSNITRATRFDSIFPLVFLDVETTGLQPSKSEIVEVSAIKFSFGMVPVSCFTTLCKPRKPIPTEATAINHITDDMVADAPGFCQIAPALTEFIRGCNVAGHNLDFDLRFIFSHGACLPENKRFYDTLDIAHMTIKKSDICDYKLDTLCIYYGIWRERAHRSLSDCYATSKIFSKLVFDKTSWQLEASEEFALN